jgi:hypothetical protein
MNKAIGEAAEVIWSFISEKSQPIELSTLKKNVPLSSTFLIAGLGWLAREDKLDIDVNIEKSDDPYAYSIFPKRQNIR